MRTKRPVMCNNNRILFSFLVIALSAVIAVNCISDTPPEAPIKATNSEAAAAPADPQPIAAQSPKQPAEHIIAKQGESVSGSELDKQIDSKSAAQEALKVDSEVAKRKARSESSPAASPAAESKPADKASPAAASPPKAAVAETKPAVKSAAASKPAPAASPAAPAAGAASSSSSSGAAAASGSKLAAKSKLPANLGTVTSTGSGGPAHYMSKHDAYSAIAEKHGALAQDAMRKSDKRQLQGGFGGIQKAGGLGDMFGPFKSVSDSGLARTLGASMRSIMKSKYSVPAYVASALLGAVALMAFYESPISPLPVPALPEPPVGRFPPEMPNISPNTQVPFRTNQQQYNQQNYNQRSLYSGIAPPNGQSYLGQQAQQVLFPGSNTAQQRSQISSSPSGPVQLAANLLGKQQIAQRKSGVDYEQSTSRSFFSPSATPAQPKQGTNAGASTDSSQQKQNSFLSFFGIGGNASPAAAADLPSAGKMAAQAALAAAAANNNNQVGQMGALNTLEPKGQSGLYNSNFVNKFKSFFTRSPAQPASATSSFLSAHPLGAYDQYQRMSFVQALLKDNNFLPGFLSPSRKSSSTPTGPNPPSASSNKLQMVTNAIASATSGTSPTARMQVAGDLNQMHPSNSGAHSLQPGAANKQKQTGGSGGYGFAKAADRIAHALFETFTSGMAQRSASPSNGQSTMDNSPRKSSSNDDVGHSASSPISSIITDVISSAVYSAASNGEQQLQQSNGEQAALKSASTQQQGSPQQQQSSAQQQSGNSQDTSASGRSLDAPSTEDRASASPAKQPQQQTSVTSNKQQQSSGSSAAATEAGHVRKTRSIGLEYASEGNQELVQQPSKAAQINSVIDLIADSYSQNRFLFNFVMNRVGLSHAVPYVEQILASDGPGNQH